MALDGISFKFKVGGNKKMNSSSDILKIGPMRKRKELGENF